MKISSYFIGLLLNDFEFDSLFVNLQDYIKRNNLEKSISLQNKNSLHLTIYYLRNDLKISEINEIKKDLLRVSKNIDLDVNLSNFSYLMNNSKKTLCYLNCTNIQILKQLNSNFSKKYKHSDVPDNSFDFIPHITLYRILNTSMYEKHEKALEKIIEDKLIMLKDKNIFKSINLFKVDSSVKPELQVPLE